MIYRIEFWDPKHSRYRPGWIGSDLAMAEKMYNKPYNRIHTRRLVRVQEEILYKDKGKR